MLFGEKRLSKIDCAVFTNFPRIYIAVVLSLLYRAHTQELQYLSKHFFGNFDGARRLTRERESFAESLVGLSINATEVA